jgi:hypothetical protein
MATVSFATRFDQIMTSCGFKLKPVCSKACGSSACRNARLKGTCPGDGKSQNLVTCVGLRYIDHVGESDPKIKVMKIVREVGEMREVHL